MCQIKRYLIQILMSLSALSLLYILAILLYQILSRIVPFLPSALWIEEASRMVFVWIILLGSTLAVIQHSHFVIDIFEGKIGGIYKKISDFIIHALILIVSLFFLFYGYDYMMFGMMQNSAYMQLNLGIYLYSSLFICSVIWAISSIVQLVLIVKNINN